MDILSFVLLGLIIVWAIAAILYLVRHGTCGCGSTGLDSTSCSSCNTCHRCKRCRKKHS